MISVLPILEENPDLKMAMKLVALFIVTILVVSAFIMPIAILFIAYVIMYRPTSYVYIGYIINSSWLQAVTSIFGGVALALVAWLFLTRVDKEKASLQAFGMGISEDTVRRFLTGLMQSMAFSLLIYGIVLLMNVVGLISYGDINSLGFITPFILLTVGSLAISFGEEILFRGYVQTMLTKKYGIVLALPLASLFFTIYQVSSSLLEGHIYPLNLLAIFVYGLILGYLFYATRSLWACGAFHAFQALSVGLVSVATDTLPIPSETAMFIITASDPIFVLGIEMGNWQNVIMVIAGVAILLVMVAYYRYQRKIGQEDAEEAAGKDGATML